MVVSIPYDSSISGVEVAKLLVEKVFCKFGFAGDLVSDRDSRFTSGFLCGVLCQIRDTSVVIIIIASGVRWQHRNSQ